MGEERSEEKREVEKEGKREMEKRVTAVGRTEAGIKEGRVCVHTGSRDTPKTRSPPPPIL